jgi:hypothetical protein
LQNHNLEKKLSNLALTSQDPVNTDHISQQRKSHGRYLKKKSYPMVSNFNKVKLYFSFH